MNPNYLIFEQHKPEDLLSDFVESFWFLRNNSKKDREVVVLPDGRIDLMFSHSPGEPFHVTLMGIGTKPDHVVLKADTILFAISFKLLGSECLDDLSVGDLLDSARRLSPGFWSFNSDEIKDFRSFCDKAGKKIQLLLPREVDDRKLKLFDLIYKSKGSLSIKDLSEKIHWSSRQINRYFSRHFGLSLKAYCTILRFRASFQHIKEGKLFPEEKFADQSHFIKEVKKLSGVPPKDLSKNLNDRFIQFSTLKKK